MRLKMAIGTPGNRSSSSSRGPASSSGCGCRGDLIFLFIGILPVVYLVDRMFAARRRYARLPAEAATEEFTQWYEEE